MKPSVPYVVDPHASAAAGVQVEIDTFAPAKVRRAPLARLTGWAIDELFGPSLEGEHGGRAWRSINPDAYVDRSRHQVLLLALQGRRRVSPDYVDRAGLDLVLEQLEHGTASSLLLEMSRPDASDESRPPIGIVMLDVARLSRKEAHYLYFAYYPATPADLDLGRQEALVEAVCTAAADANASTAVITYDTLVNAHEHSIGVQAYEGRESSGELLRGYGWGNLLTGAHLDALGGRARVVAEAPVYAARDLSDERDERVFLQLTPSIWDFDDRALRDLKAFLGDVLAVPTKPGTPSGPPLRVV